MKNQIQDNVESVFYQQVTVVHRLKRAWYHEVQVGGKWQKFYDPGKNDNERSPLTEVYEELISTGKESDKKLRTIPFT